MSELHQALLDMLLAFDRYCASRGLHYTLFAGTLLGAVRHKGSFLGMTMSIWGCHGRTTIVW